MKSLTRNAFHISTTIKVCISEWKTNLPSMLSYNDCSSLYYHCANVFLEGTYIGPVLSDLAITRETLNNFACTSFNLMNM